MFEKHLPKSSVQVQLTLGNPQLGHLMGLALAQGTLFCKAVSFRNMLAHNPRIFELGSSHLNPFGISNDLAQSYFWEKGEKSAAGGKKEIPQHLVTVCAF